MRLNLIERFLASKGSRAIEDGSIRFTDHANKLHSQGEATVSKEIKPHMKGRVYFQGTWWPAQCEQEACLLPGEIVEVVGIRGITLLVRPKESEHPRQENIAFLG